MLVNALVSYTLTSKSFTFSRKKKRAKIGCLSELLENCVVSKAASQAGKLSSSMANSLLVIPGKILYRLIELFLVKELAIDKLQWLNIYTKENVLRCYSVRVLVY